MANVIRSGLGVFLERDDGKVIVGTRKNVNGAGFVALPGGHIEFGESFEQCAARELLEETGLDIPETSFRFVTAISCHDMPNSKQPDVPLHYVIIYMHARIADGREPVNTEPDKCEGWQWMSLDELRALGPDRMFLPLRRLLFETPGFKLPVKLP